MKFFIATDHAGFPAKAFCIAHLTKQGHKVTDLGPDSDGRVDYPDFAQKLCAKVAEEPGSFGVLICGTGIGMSMAANKCPGIRAALCQDAYTSAMARAHNDANVLCFGQRVVGEGVMESILDAFCNATFEGGRHQGRVEKIG